MLRGAIGVFLLCFLAGCSPWKKMVSWLPFQDKEKSQYALTDKKIEEFTRTIKPTNNDAESHYRLACFYQERKKHQLAIKEFKKTLQNDPGYVKAYNGLGVSYDLLGEFPRAVNAYEGALRLNPNLAYIYNNLGYSYLLQKKLDSAVNAFQQAVALDKENRQYHNNLGLAYGQQGKYELAFNEFKSAGNEEKARRYMADLFNQNPNLYPNKTLVAKNFPPNNNNENNEEKLSQDAPIDKSIHEEKLVASPSGNLLSEQKKYCGKPKDKTKDVLFSKNIGASTRPSSSAIKAKTLSDNRPLLQKLPVVPKGIEVSNGNGIRHFARSVAFYLGKKGFKVSSLKNEPRFNNLKTTFYYCDGYLQDAYSLAKQIPQRQDVVKVTGFKNRNIKVKIVVGKDMASYYKIFKAEQRRCL
jgi:tetratricopeptide (TPR) repeat protein